MRAPAPARVDLGDPVARASLRLRLSALYAGRPVVVGPGSLAALAPVVDLLRAAGSSRQLLLATGRGTGRVPAAADDVTIEPIEPIPVVSVTEEMRTHDTLLRHLPAAVVDRVERFDPARQALFHATPFVSDEPVLGRPVTMGRPAAIRALEDKLLADTLWAEVGVTAAPSRVVPATLPDLRAATAALTGPHGAVWSGDARDGVNGAGDFVRWVRTPDDELRAHAFFAPRCDRVRVMPFLVGVPCSVHGVVLPDGTAALRPVELVTLLDPARSRFVPVGLSTHWEPPAGAAVRMRAVVRRVGEHLRATRGYRGVLGIDGVLTAEGFRPTELNSRLSAGALLVPAGLDEALLPLLQANLLAGRDPGVSAADVETLVPAVARAPAARLAVRGETGSPPASETLRLAWRGDSLVCCADGGSALTLSATATGLHAALDPCGLQPPGERMAGLAVALTAFLDRDHDTDFGPLVAAGAGPGPERPPVS